MPPRYPRNAPPPKERYRLNHQIRLPEVFLIGPDGEQIGAVPTDEARRRAEAAGLDLVEVAPHARPPVCKILDYGKFKYDQKKKQHRQRAATTMLKEIRVRPKIGEHDLEIKIKKAREFLGEGHKVQVTCLFRGREMAYQHLGAAVMERVVTALADVAKVERQPRQEGRRMNLLLGRK